jgi:hypothetical protein
LLAIGHQQSKLAGVFADVLSCTFAVIQVLTELRKKAGAGGAARSGRRSKSSGEEQEQGEQDTQGDN